MRAFGIDTFAAYDMKAEMDMTQMGQKVAVAFTGKTMGTRGMRGGDMDASFIRDLKLQVEATESPFMSTPAMNFQYAIEDISACEDMRFDKLYAHMAKGTMPPRTETRLPQLWPVHDARTSR